MKRTARKSWAIQRVQGESPRARQRRKADPQDQERGNAARAAMIAAGNGSATIHPRAA